jgi:uncharacterized protein YbjT (DUF2867 family)
MRIAIAGGTGTVGRHVVAAAERVGHEPVVLSRANGVDLMSAAGLADRLAGVDAVIDVSATARLSTGPAVEFFTTVTRNLLDAERAAGVGHHVALSIVGAAAGTSGYYAGKAAQESVVTASDVPWTLLRTTQFHEFAMQTAARGTILGFHVSPSMRTQPIAASEVADELVRIVERDPAGVVPDLAGPREERMSDMVARYLAAVGRPGRVLTVPLPGSSGRIMRSGGLLPGPGARFGEQTFDEWLARLDDRS